MRENGITVFVDSASRPDLLQQCILSLKRFLCFHDVPSYWIMHESFIDKEHSIECLKIAKEFFEDIIVRDPPRGQGFSVDETMKKIKTKYMIYWVDDHIAVRDIDLRVVYKCMEENLDVNQITFNKRKTMPDVSGWIKKEFKKGDLILTTSPHWRYMPSIWRIDWILQFWKCFPDVHDSHWKINMILQGSDRLVSPELKTPEWVAENMGTYYLGPIAEKAYSSNIGSGRGQRDPRYK